MSEKQFFNQKEGTLGKESLQEEYMRLQDEYRRLNQKTAESNASLNEQQKEFRGEDAPTADFDATHQLTELKTKRLAEIDARLKAINAQLREQ